MFFENSTEDTADRPAGHRPVRLDSDPKTGVKLTSARFTEHRTGQTRQQTWQNATGTAGCQCPRLSGVHRKQGHEQCSCAAEFESTADRKGKSVKFQLKAICLLVLISGAGCSYRAENKEMATRPEPPTAESPAATEAAWSTVNVYYGTNRLPTNDSLTQSDTAPNKWYSNASATSLQYGTCEVSIPDTHEYGEIERPRIWKFEFKENPDRHVMLKSVNPQAGSRVLELISADLAKSERQQAFVFIHGYNVTFPAAARRTAQMAFDLKFDGPPIFFSWPSRGKLSGYVADLEEADGAAIYLQQFLEQVAGDTGAREVHVIAHSMGNRVLAGALDRMAAAATHRPVARFNQILLAAPDIDAERFRDEIAPRISSRADRMTIYASSKDKALVASRSLHQAIRLGQGGDALTLFPDIRNIDVIDASAVDFGFFELGHSAYGNELLMDIRQTLDGVPAASRPLQPHQSALAWRVPAGSDHEQTNAPVQTVSLQQKQPEIANEPTETDSEPAHPQASRRTIWQRLRFWR